MKKTLKIEESTHTRLMEVKKRKRLVSLSAAIDWALDQFGVPRVATDESRSDAGEGHE